MKIRSDAFEHQEQIPERFTTEGEEVSPPLRWADVPEGTRSLALVCEDPDAPTGTFVHWLAWGLDPGSDGLQEGEDPPVEGTTGFGETGYGPPAPPPGHGPHRYRFRIHALDEELDLAPGANRISFDDAIEGHVLDSAELVGIFER